MSALKASKTIYFLRQIIAFYPDTRNANTACIGRFISCYPHLTQNHNSDLHVYVDSWNELVFLFYLV